MIEIPRFPEMFPQRFGLGGKAAALPWYLPAGVPLANCKIAYQFKGAANQAASYINLAKPGTNNATASTAPTWDTSVGCIFNGSDQFLLTGFVPIKQTYSYVIGFTSFTQGSNKYLFGAASFSAARVNCYSSTSTILVYYSGDALVINPAAISAGTLAIAGTTAYRNGTAETGSIPTAAGDLATYDLYLGCWNYRGTAQNFSAVTINRFAVYDIILTQPQVAAIGSATLPLV